MEVATRNVLPQYIRVVEAEAVTENVAPVSGCHCGIDTK